MELLGDVGQVESRFVCLETVLVLVEYRCTVCPEHTIGLKIVLDAHDGTTMRHGPCRISFRSV
jgi:hypothetical protein